MEYREGAQKYDVGGLLLLKRIFVGLLIIMAICFLYFYQIPIISTDEATIKAVEHLQTPPEEFKVSIPYVELRDIPAENISVHLKKRNGFFNELTNRQQWEITINYQGIEPTIVMDAYTGKYIDMYGPLN